MSTRPEHKSNFVYEKSQENLQRTKLGMLSERYFKFEYCGATHGDRGPH